MRKTEQQSPVTPIWNLGAMRKLALDGCERYREGHSVRRKRQDPGFTICLKEKFRHIKQYLWWTWPVFAEGRKLSSSFSPCSLRKAISFRFLWMRRLVLEIFASEKSDTQMKGRVRKPVADGVNDKRYTLLNVKSRCVQKEWHKTLGRIDRIEQNGTNSPVTHFANPFYQDPCPSLPVEIPQPNTLLNYRYTSVCFRSEESNSNRTAASPAFPTTSPERRPRSTPCSTCPPSCSSSEARQPSRSCVTSLRLPWAGQVCVAPTRPATVWMPPRWKYWGTQGPKKRQVQNC